MHSTLSFAVFMDPNCSLRALFEGLHCAQFGISYKTARQNGHGSVMIA